MDWNWFWWLGCGGCVGCVRGWCGWCVVGVVWGEEEVFFGCAKQKIIIAIWLSA